jgi:D-3-phosphoglycerate dehydrogenase / 2-oxoglutarate reductase
VTAGQGPRPLVLVTSRSFGSGDADPERLLTDGGLRVIRGDAGHDPDALVSVLGEASGWIAGAAAVTAVHLESAPNLRIIARYGTGVDAIDLGAARSRGIVVTNTPGANAEAVAEHTLALILASLRQVVHADRAVRQRASGSFVGRELRSLTVGLVGLGRVGRAVARRLVALDVRVLGVDPAYGPDELADVGVTAIDLDRLLAGSDVVSLHRPGGGPPVLDAPRLATLRRGAVVINTARRDLVDEAALARMLHEGRIGAAAVDDPHSVDGPLGTAPRTILTPHIAGHTMEAIDGMGVTAAEEVLRVLVRHEPPRHAVTA